MPPPQPLPDHSIAIVKRTTELVAQSERRVADTMVLLVSCKRAAAAFRLYEAPPLIQQPRADTTVNRVSQ